MFHWVWHHTFQSCFDIEMLYNLCCLLASQPTCLQNDFHNICLPYYTKDYHLISIYKRSRDKQIMLITLCSLIIPLIHETQDLSTLTLTTYSVFLFFFFFSLHVFNWVVELWKFFTYPGYNLLIGYRICKTLSHFVDFCLFTFWGAVLPTGRVLVLWPGREPPPHSESTRS